MSLAADTISFFVLNSPSSITWRSWFSNEEEENVEEEEEDPGDFRGTVEMWVMAEVFLRRALGRDKNIRPSPTVLEELIVENFEGPIRTVVPIMSRVSSIPTKFEK